MAKGVPGLIFSHAVLWASCSSLLPPCAYRLTPLLFDSTTVAGLTAPSHFWDFPSHFTTAFQSTFPAHFRVMCSDAGNGASPFDPRASLSQPLYTFIDNRLHSLSCETT